MTLPQRLKSPLSGAAKLKARSPIFHCPPPALAILILPLSLGACGSSTLEITQDFAGDASIDARNIFEFDGALRVYDRFDNGADGTWDGSVSRRFDRSGRLISLERAQEGELISGESFSYDDGDMPTLRLEDGDGDGLAEVEHSYGYDGQGRLISILSQSEASTSRTTLRWGDKGVEAVSLDRGDDGSVNRESIFAYGEGGALGSLELDVNGDGVVDSIYTYTFEGGQLKTRGEDFDGDGAQEYVSSYEYGEAGILRSERVNALGELVREDVYIYGEGVLERLDSDWDGDGALDLITYYKGGHPEDILEFISDPMPEARPPSPFDSAY